MEIIGQKFNKLKIIEVLLKDHRDRHQARCICDCGTECIRNLSAVKRGRSKSCGCLYFEYRKSPQGIEDQRKGSLSAADAIRLPYGISSFKKLLANYKKNAVDRNLVFELTDDQFKVLIGGLCFYCDEKPAQICFGENSNGEYIYNGIDRVNNTLRYSLDNCASCCGVCNKMKMGSPPEDFLKKIKLIYEKHFKNGSDL